MIVVVAVDGEGSSRLDAEQAHVLRVGGDGVWHSRATDMVIEANDAVALGHDDVEVVADQEHAEAVRLPQAADQCVDLGLADVIDAAHRLVEHQEFGAAQEGARQQHALQLAPGEARKLTACQPLDSHLREPLGDRRPRGVLAEGEESTDRHRDGRVDVEALRHVADAEPGTLTDLTGVGALDAEQHAHQRRFAGTIGTDKSDDLARLYVEIDAAEKAAARSVEDEAACRNERGRIETREAHGSMMVVASTAGFTVRVLPLVPFG